MEFSEDINCEETNKCQSSSIIIQVTFACFNMVEYALIGERTKILGHRDGMDKSGLGKSDIQRDMVNRVNNCLSMS